MAGHSGPRIMSNSLAFNVGAKSVELNKPDTNILAPYTWSVGTGSETFYSQNGDGNSRIIGTDPFGNQSVLWQTINNDTTSDADGGWNTTAFPVDRTKTYRFSVWVKRQVLGNGSFYLGCHGYGSTNGVASNDSLAWAANTNPYFCSTGWPQSVGQWYLVVGHVFPWNWSTIGDHSDSGWYLPGNATKIATIDDRDYRWHSSTTSANHRTYLYYSTDTTTHQLWYAPRVDLCDGTEPSIADLVSATNIRQSVVSDDSVYINGPTEVVNSTARDPSYYVFDGSGTTDGVTYGDHIVVPEATTSTANYSSGCTYSFWINVDTDADDRLALFRGSSTIRHIEIYSSSKKFRTESAMQNNYSFGSGTFPDDVRGVWSHFAIVFANGESGRPVRWYQNGKLFYTGTLDGGTYPGEDYFSFSAIGRSTGSSSYLYARSFKGKMSSFKISDKALTSREVYTTYAAFRRRYK